MANEPLGEKSAYVILIREMPIIKIMAYQYISMTIIKAKKNQELVRMCKKVKLS